MKNKALKDVFYSVKQNIPRQLECHPIISTLFRLRKLDLVSLFKSNEILSVDRKLKYTAYHNYLNLVLLQQYVAFFVIFKIKQKLFNLQPPEIMRLGKL